MTDFNLGDRVRITLTSKNSSIEADVVCTDLENFADEFRGFKAVLPEEVVIYKYDEVVNDENLTVELVKPFEERLPHTPGVYFEINDYLVEIAEALGGSVNEIFEAVAVENEAVWTLNEDGTWTDSTGATQPTTHNWILAVQGVAYFPVTGLYTSPAEADAEPVSGFGLSA